MKKLFVILLLSCHTGYSTAQNWSLLGNSGTNPANNFLGTTDNAPLVFRVNGGPAGLLDATAKNVFFGSGTGANVSAFGLENTGVGNGALAALTHGRYNASFGSRAMGGNTSVEQNCAFGINALGSNTTASSNSAFGAWSLDGNTTGARNTAVGTLSLSSNTTGSDNVAVGASALSVNKAGSRAVAIGSDALRYANGTSTAFNNLNVAVGYQAMHGSISTTANTGNRNTALGYQALNVYTTGNENTSIGAQAMFVATTGSANTAVGNLALATLSTGSNNTGIGRLANVSVGTLSNATALGYNATVNASNKVRLGNTSITVVEGQAPYTNPSDARFKQSVREDVLGLSLILKLRPVSYTFDRHAFAKHINEDTEGREGELAAASQARTVGFLAQEVEKTVEELRFTAFDAVHAPENPTDNYGLAYAQFIVPLVKAVQELHAENAALLERIEQLERKLDPAGAEGLHVFPVPAQDAISVAVHATSAGLPATLEFFDASGRQVHQFTTGALPALLTVPLPGELMSGTYLLVLRPQGQAPKTSKVVVKR